jgi:U4/U6 small nuclear ribonucleoprotein PRP4
MRSLKAMYTIPAHLNNVADIRFFRSDGSIPAHVQGQRPIASTDVQMEDAADAAEDAEADSRPGGDNGKESLAPLTAKQEHEKLSEEWRYRSGLYLASAGYDGVVKIWSADDWQLLHTLQTDGSKVMSVDLSADARMLVSGTYNRNFQLFAPESAMNSL